MLLYYCLAVDSTGLPAVTAIESALSHATQITKQAAERLLSYYFRNYPDTILVLKACDMRPSQMPPTVLALVVVPLLVALLISEMPIQLELMARF